jgi:hypothetical protein
MSAPIPLAAWEPDKASNDASVSALAINAFPQVNGWGPVPSPIPFGFPLPDVCRGAFDVRKADGTWVHYVGTATKLYRSNPATLGWDDISGPSPYLLPPEDYWSFALYGPLLIATHTGAPPQTIDIENDTAFADLTYTSPDPPPHARFVAIVNEFVFFGGLLDNEAAVQWSAIADPHYWTPGINDSDIQILPDGGRVTGLVGGDTLIVFQETSIQQFVFAAGTAAVFQRTKIEDARGAIAPWSIVKVGAAIYFLDRDGFYLFAGGASTPIGKERVNRWFQSLRDPTFAETTVVVADPTGSRVFWAFKSVGGSDATKLDLAFCYDFAQDRFAQISLPQPIRYWFRAQTSPVTLDSITQSVEGSAPYDFTIGLSLDSAIFSGGVPSVGVFGLDNKYALLQGPSLEATLETCDAQLARPARAYARGVRLDSDADNWFVSVGTRESLAKSVPVRWRTETAPNAERFAYCHASGRYHRARVRIQAGDAWTYAKSVEPDAVAEGMR